MKTLKLLPESEFKNIKIIQIEGPQWNSFTGYLPYQRILNKEYNYKEGDDLDKNLLDTIQKKFPNSSLAENRLILLEEELEERLEKLRFGSEKKFTMNFFPFIDIPKEQLKMHKEKLFNPYLIDFNLRLMISTTNEKYNNVYDSDMCYIHFEVIDKLIKTIRPL